MYWNMALFYVTVAKTIFSLIFHLLAQSVDLAFNHFISFVDVTLGNNIIKNTDPA